MFGCTYLGDGNDSATGNVNTVTGQSGSITNGKNYDYLYRRGPDNYVDYIGANGGTIFFKSQDGFGRAVNYGGTSNNYRAIHTTFIFGALRNGTNTKNELMSTYMQYLLATNVEESEPDVALHNLTIAPNPSRQNTNIGFSLPRLSHVGIKVYNITGQMVRELVNGELNKGEHQFKWNGRDNSGKQVSCGSYILRIQIDNETINRIIVLTR